MLLGTMAIKGKTPCKVEASKTKTPATAMETTNSPNPKRTKRRRKIDSIQSNAGFVAKQGTPKSSADHEKAMENL